ncbi:hypothetical protein DAEQUDRAFT_743254 [Daedalea quercina L-15889]|uniref:Uncharacterized protein n=1 Tax=Daedalea quercina L-15889 TaxID=1314783 RepID=A0A165T6E6_9APHY|nr:hypothetical protein DAEQUDRAFT_743254 [Daedalea quercina L-15889]
MHLVWENVLKNLVSLWTGEYKGLDSGTEDYVLDPDVWKAIGEATASAGSTIPSVYGPRPPNVQADRTACTADSWSFWALYIAPVVLRGRFRQEKYYNHFIKLIKILHTCLQFELTRAEVESVRTGLANWVTEYEGIYYQHDSMRLSACPVTIHALLHVADSILLSGPVWASWSFPMERYCGILKPAIRSRRFPFVALDNYVADTAQLAQLKVVYSAAEALGLRSPVRDHSTSIPGYIEIDTHALLDDTCALLPPKRVPETLADGLRDKILGCLSTRYDVPGAAVRFLLPQKIARWGKVQILGGGDLIRSSNLGGSREDSRNASFVRYESLVDRNVSYRNRPTILELRTFYGELQDIFVLKMPASQTLKLTEPEHLVLAGIRTCTLDNRSAPGGLDIHYYTNTGRYEVIDMKNIQCLVGRIFDRGQWAIVDRSGGLARAMYNDDEDV